MHDDGDHETDDSAEARAEDDGRIDVGLLVQDQLANLQGMGAQAPHVDQGPRPRALSKARIQVKSDGKAPRVRSSKLRPRRQVRTDPAMQRDSGKGLNESDVLAGLERGRTVVRTARLLSDVEEIASREDLVARRGPKKRLLAPLQILAALLLLETALMPSVRLRTVVAPWSAWSDPTSPNFVALAFLALLALLFAFPLTRFARTCVQACSALLLLAFSIVLLRSALAMGSFDGQPALHLLAGDGLAGGIVVLASACSVPTALFWLQRVPESRRARHMLTGAVTLVLAAYGGLSVVTQLEEAPLFALWNATSEGAFLGDRLAAWCAYLPLLGALVALVFYGRSERSARTGMMGIAMWIFALAPMMTLALYVAPSERWHEVLVPVQITTLVGAGLLLFSVCLGHVLALTEVGED